MHMTYTGEFCKAWCQWTHVFTFVLQWQLAYIDVGHNGLIIIDQDYISCIVFPLKRSQGNDLKQNLQTWNPQIDANIAKNIIISNILRWYQFCQEGNKFILKDKI